MVTEAPVASAAPAEGIVKGVTAKANGSKPAPAIDPKTGKPAAVAPDPNAGKEKYVVEGKEYWLTPEQEKAYVGKGIGYEPKVSELGRLQNETSQFFELLKKDPAKVLYDKRIGLTPEIALEKILGSAKVSDAIKETLGKWYYENVVRLEKLDPVARELEQTKKDNADLRAAEERRTMDATARENLQRVNAAMGQIKAQISEAVKEVGLVKNIDSPLGAQIVKRIADVMRLSHLAKKPITPKEAASKVRAEILSINRLHLDELEGDALVEAIGKENADKVRKYFLKVVKEAEKTKKEPTGEVSARVGARKVMTEEDFKAYLEERKKNG